MLKKFSKILLLILLVLIVSTSSFLCLAHEDDEHEETTNNTTSLETNDKTTTNDTVTTEEIHYGDLYLFDNEIVMDQLVDGNVFIFGNKVEITGQVNGNLFIFADNVYYNGACNDLYVAATNLEMTYDSYVARDLKAIGSNVILKSFIVRDANVLCNTLDLGEGNNIPIIYGDLNYTANTEVTVPEGVMISGSVTYTKPSELNNDTTSSVVDILIGFATCIVTALALYIILNKLTPKFIDKISNQKFSFKNLLKAFGIGLSTIIIAVIFFILLIGTTIGVNLAFLLALIFAIVCIIAVPTLSISITNTLKPTLKIDKTSIFYLVLVLVSIILYGITFIPYIGGLLGFIINVTAIGLIINIYLPHKELTDEERLSIEEAKKQAKENKEKLKKEKLEAKAARKQEKLEAKEAKKKSKEI